MNKTNKILGTSLFIIALILLTILQFLGGYILMAVAIILIIIGVIILLKESSASASEHFIVVKEEPYEGDCNIKKEIYVKAGTGKRYIGAEVELVSPNLKSADDWMVMLHGAFDIYLNIRDEEFMKNILDGEVSFTGNNILICDLLFIGSKHNKNVFEARNIECRKNQQIKWR